MLEVIEIEAMNHYRALEDNRFLLRAMVKLFGVKDRERAGRRHSRAPAAKTHRAGQQSRTMCPAVEEVIEVREVVGYLCCRSKVGRLLRTRGKVAQLTKSRGAPALTAKNHESEEWTRIMLEIIAAKGHNHGWDNRFLQTIVRIKERGGASDRHRSKPSAAKFHGPGKQTWTASPVIGPKQAVEPQVTHHRGQTILEDNLNIRLLVQIGSLT